MMKKRRRGWKLLMLSPLMLLLVLIVCHTIWRVHGARQVRAIEAAIRSAGEPVTIADLAEPAIPDGDNLAVLLRAAASMWVYDQAIRRARDDHSHQDDAAFEMPLTADEVDLLRQSVLLNAKALEILADADRRPTAVWNDQYTSPMVTQTIDSSLADARKLAHLLGDAAKMATHDRRALDAILALRDLKAIGRATDKKAMLIGHLTSMGIHALAATLAFELSPRLDFDDPATIAETKKLIAELLDDDVIIASARYGLQTERVAVHDGMLWLKNGRLVNRAVMTPYFHRNDVTLLNYFGESLKLADKPTWADFQQNATERQRIYASVKDSKLGLLASILIPAVDNTAQVRYRVLTDRHLAAATLAIRLYQFDHDGKKPPTLQTLVPTYLPKIPIDAIDGNPLRYDATRGLLWSVGDNGTDEDGDTSPMSSRVRHLRDHWSTLDAVVPLDPIARPPAPPVETP